MTYFGIFGAKEKERKGKVTMKMQKCIEVNILLKLKDGLKVNRGEIILAPGPAVRRSYRTQDPQLWALSAYTLTAIFTLVELVFFFSPGAYQSYVLLK